MAKKKGGFGRFIGAITGSPYERLQKQIDKVVAEADNDKSLARTLKKLVKAIGDQYEEENIDDEEHDLLIESIEEVDPNGRTFNKLNDDSDDFYDGGDLPDAPTLNLGKRKNLDELMKSQGNEFTGSFGRDEFEEYRRTMAADFYAESDDAVASGDHQHEIRTQNRVFADAEDGIGQLKKQMAEESGLEDPTSSDEDENYYTDDDGVEWWKDDDGYWWYREPGQEDWQPHE
ncbi:MAG: hypothetical protein QGI21_02350 [Candidatus Poseidoniaceae archaeon]|jgi:hypothetical protein|nr:hypothetical protein [Candidatus Poseidoniaceae archaeon]